VFVYKFLTATFSSLLTRHHLLFSEKLDEMRQALNEFQRDYSEVVAKFVRTRDEVRRLQVEAERDAPLVDINGHDLPIKAKLDGLEATTIEEAEAALDEATAKANSIDDNPDVVRQYEQRQEEIETLQNKLQLAQGSRERKAKELKKLLEPWERKLSKSLTRASVLFSNYMAELGCAGTNDENAVMRLS
jgi:chromosome segregation ATPase